MAARASGYNRRVQSGRLALVTLLVASLTGAGLLAPVVQAQAPMGPEAHEGFKGPLAGIHWGKRVKAAEKAARERQGSVSFSIRGGGVKRSRDGNHRFHSASVVKAMLLVAYLRENSHRKLDGGEKELLTVMIRRSDNRAATTVRDIVGNGSLENLADKAGLDCFATNAASWGSTEICAKDMALFMKKIEGLLPKRHRAFAMELLRTIVTKQRWGFGQIAGNGWTPFFKGGWYADRVHQIALLRGPGGAELAVAILTSGQPGKAYGIETVTKVARALVGPVVNGK